jgi:hypothetical protein
VGKKSDKAHPPIHPTKAAANSLQGKTKQNKTKQNFYFT